MAEIKNLKNIELVSSFLEKIKINKSISLFDKICQLSKTHIHLLRHSMSQQFSESLQSENQLKVIEDYEVKQIKNNIQVFSFIGQYSIGCCNFTYIIQLYFFQEKTLMIKFDTVSEKLFNNISVPILVDPEESKQDEISKLQANLKNKNLFISQITHDMRTPLSCVNYMIDSVTQSIENQSSIEPKIQEELLYSLDICRSNVETLQNLINDILDFGQLGQGTLKIIQDEFSISEIIDSLNKILKIQAQLKNINFQIQNNLPVEQQQLNSDQRRIKQILINLISNAFKFTLKGSVIVAIDKTEISSQIKFSVKDTGLGIKKEILEKLNENIEYTTFDNECGINKEGIGLGLTICRSLISRLGPSGELHIESEINKGSIFSFKIFTNLEKNKKQNLYQSNKSKLFVNNSAQNFLILQTKLENQKNNNELCPQTKSKYQRSSFAKPEQQVQLQSQQQQQSFNYIQENNFSSCNIHFSEKEYISILSLQKFNFIHTNENNILIKNKGAISERVSQENQISQHNQSNKSSIKEENNSSKQLVLSQSELQYSQTLGMQNLSQITNLITQFVELQEINIVLVDDNVFNLLILEQFINKNNHYTFKVKKATNGLECLNLFLESNQEINQNNIDIIIMDCQLPIMTGYESSLQIKQKVENQDYVDLIIIAYTANQGEEEIQKCLDNKMDGYLQKPTNLKEFNQLLDKFLQSETKK